MRSEKYLSMPEASAPVRAARETLWISSTAIRLVRLSMQPRAGNAPGKPRNTQSAATRHENERCSPRSAGTQPQDCPDGVGAQAQRRPSDGGQGARVRDPTPAQETPAPAHRHGLHHHIDAMIENDPADATQRGMGTPRRRPRRHRVLRRNPRLCRQRKTEQTGSPRPEPTPHTGDDQG